MFYNSIFRFKATYRNIGLAIGTNTKVIIISLSAKSVENYLTTGVRPDYKLQNSCLPHPKRKSARQYAGRLHLKRNMRYFVTRSSHLTMPSMTPIDMAHTTMNTVQHCHIGILLYIRGPIHNSRLPTAVAPNHRP